MNTNQKSIVRSENVMSFFALREKHFPTIESLNAVFSVHENEAVNFAAFESFLYEAIQEGVISLDDSIKAHRLGYCHLFDYAMKHESESNKPLVGQTGFNDFLVTFAINLQMHWESHTEKMAKNGVKEEDTDTLRNILNDYFLKALVYVNLSEQSTCACCGQFSSIRWNKDLVLYPLKAFEKPCMEMSLVESEIEITSGALLFSDWFRDDKNILQQKQKNLQEASEFGSYPKPSYAAYLNEQKCAESLGFFSAVAYSGVNVFFQGNKIIVADGAEKISKIGDIDYVSPDGWEDAGMIDVCVRRVTAITPEKLKEHWVDVPKEHVDETVNNSVKANVETGQYKVVNACFNRQFIPKADYPDWFPEGMANVVCYFEKV